jgi:hypothetical protein
MCDKCDELDERILKFRRFIAQPVDPLTTERLTASVSEMQATKAALHPEKKYSRVTETPPEPRAVSSIIPLQKGTTDWSAN